MNHQKVIRYFIMALFCLTLAVPGGAMAEQKVFTLGIMGPMTGAAGKIGTDIKNGATLAFQKAGDKIGDYKIKLVYVDDQADAVKAASALSEAIEQQGIQAVMMDWDTAVTLTAMDVCAKYKIPFFFPMGSSYTVNNKFNSEKPSDRYLIMKGWPEPQKLESEYVDCLNYYIKKGFWKPKQKIVALYGEDTDWGRSVVAGLRKALLASGWKVYSEQYFPLTQTDFYPFLSQCKKAGVTALMGTTSGTASVAALVKQHSEIGLDAVLACDGLGWVGDWYKLVGPSSNGVIDMIQQISTPSQKAFAAEYQKEFGVQPSPAAAGHAYDYGNFFIKIAKFTIEKTGKLDSASLFKIGTEYVRSGKLTYSEADGALFHKKYGTDPANAPDPKVGPKDYYFPIVQYETGAAKVVYPLSEKQVDMTFPK